MHRTHQVVLCWWTGLLVALAGCSGSVPKPLVVRSIYVEDAVGSPVPELAQHADVIHDTSVRVLQCLGYVAATGPGEADAILQATWLGRPSLAAMPSGRVSLRMSLVARDGSVLKSAEVIAEVPAGFLTRERVAEEVRTNLGGLVR